MSQQTGVESQRAPASKGVADRLRFNLQRWRDDPNPLWMREMRQSVRLMRTPVIMMVVTIVVVLVMSSIGGAMTGTSDAASAGQVLFHTYFTLAYIVVTLLGPALAANSIASEREGKTWEAVMLTGLRPSVVARGKFLSSFTAIGQYIVMLAPVGALSFLFGGVGPLEVVTAFIILFAIAALGCTFGLAISSKMNSLRTALLVTFIVSVILSGPAYGIFGPGCASLAHDLWSSVPDGAPIWLPVAYARAPFGLEYLVYLIVIPLTLLGLPTWLLYEVAHANLTSVTDDRTYGIKRWYFVAMLITALLCVVPALGLADASSAPAVVAGLVMLTLFVIFCTFLFAGEPIGPSRRVRKMLRQASAVRRALAPGVVPAAHLQLIMTLLAFALVGGIGFTWVLSLNTSIPSHMRTGIDVDAIILTLAYGTGFSIFFIGLGSRLRARATSSSGPRILLLVFLVALCAGPWILAAIGGVMSRMNNENALAAASLSPIYVFIAIDALNDVDGGVRVAAAVGTAFFYALVGFGLYLSARRHCYKTIAGHEQLLAEADRRLDEEDRLAAEEAQKQADEKAHQQSNNNVNQQADHKINQQSNQNVNQQADHKINQQSNQNVNQQAGHNAEQQAPGPGGVKMDAPSEPGDGETPDASSEPT